MSRLCTGWVTALGLAVSAAPAYALPWPNPFAAPVVTLRFQVPAPAAPSDAESAAKARLHWADLRQRTTLHRQEPGELRVEAPAALASDVEAAMTEVVRFDVRRLDPTADPQDPDAWLHTGIDGTLLSRTELTMNVAGWPVIGVWLNQAGTERMAALSASPPVTLGFFLNDVLATTIALIEPIQNGVLSIDGLGGLPDAQDWLIRLEKSRMPVQLKLLTVTQGASRP